VQDCERTWELSGLEIAEGPLGGSLLMQE